MFTEVRREKEDLNKRERFIRNTREKNKLKMELKLPEEEEEEFHSFKLKRAKSPRKHDS